MLRKDTIILITCNIFLAVGLVAYIFFGSNHSFGKNNAKSDTLNPSDPNRGVKIASINLELIEEKYLYFTHIKKYIEKIKNDKDEEVLSILKKYSEKITYLQERQEQLTNKEVKLMNEAFEELGTIYENLWTYNERKIQEKEALLYKKARNKIKELIEEYNKEANFDYIFIDNNSILYIRNNTFDITNTIIALLNAHYKAEPIPIN